MRSFTRKNIFTLMLLTAMLVVAGSGVVKGQQIPDCKPQSRTYANFQGKYEGGVNVDLGILGSIFVGGTVANDANAVNGDPKSFSTLQVGAAVAGLLTSTQFLEFTTAGTNATARSLPAGKNVTVKFSLPKSVLSLLSGVEIGTFTGLTPISGSLVNKAGYNATNFYPAYSGAVLLNLINGAGDVEVTLTPTQAYNGVYLKLTGNGLAVALSADLYHAYINEDAPLGNACNTPIDVLAGVRPGTAVGGIASALAPVSTPWNAVDGIISTFAELDVTAQVLNETYHTTIFKNPGPAGDAVQIVLQKPGGGLLDLGLLNGFSIQMYNGPNQVGTAMSSSSGLLSLSLLTVSSVDYTVLTIPVPKSAGAFDRVEIKIGGVATVSLTSKLRIYEVKRIILPSPVINNIASTNLTVCPGVLTLDVKENQDCTVYNWYNVATGGSSLNNGTMPYSISNLSPGTYTYYLEATRTNCTESSGRVPITVVVNGLVTPNTISTDQSICLGLIPTAFTSTSPTGIPTSVISYQWQKSTDNINFSNITGATNAIYAEPSAITQTTYYQRIAYSTINSKICEGISNKVTVTVNNLPTITLGSNPLVCAGIATSNLTYSATSNSPTTYSIVWDAAAHSAGFVDVAFTTLPTTPIIINVPATAPVAAYAGTITVKNANGCISNLNNFSLTVHPKPAAPLITSQ